jgi:hypothetical protein
MDVNLLEADVPHVGETVRHVGRPDQGSRRHHVDRRAADGVGRVAFLHDEDLGVGVSVQAYTLARRHVDQDEGNAHAVSFAFELDCVLELLKLDRGVVARGHGPSLFRRSAYGWDMPRRKRNRSETQPTAKPKSSDQAPGEEVVQVNDQYRGGEPAPDMQQEEQAQHQTGG